MDDLVVWLRAQLDEDERTAQAALGGPWAVVDDDGAHGWSVGVAPHNPAVGVARVPDAERAEATARHIAEHDPARVLREIDAKRDLLRFAEGVHDHHETFTAGVAARLEMTLRLFAVPYADRPGYRDEWRP
ncbi:MAG: hypothetical protein HOV70_23675 [Streptomyces sp.]|nr:hypothetical protein [Streptomyces sp.]